MIKLTLLSQKESKKLILVTGGAGFIGTNFVFSLINNKKYQEKILVFDALTYSGNISNFDNLKEKSLFEFFHGDINNLKQIQSIFEKFKPRVIVNFAAETHVDRSIKDPDIFLKTNVFGTFNLLRTSLEYFNSLPEFSKDDSTISQNKFKFLQISTDEVYGSLKEDDFQFKEQDPYKPNSPYSASKASGDHLVRAWTKTYGLPAIVTNCSNNYGPFQYPEKLIPLAIQNCLSGKKIPIYGKGDQIRDWLFVDDHCSALEKIISKGIPGENYNIGGECEYRNIDLVKLICRTLDVMNIKKHPSIKKQHEELISFVPDRLGHDHRYGVDITKIKNDLNWQPSISIEEGMKRTVLWYLENKNWVNNLRTN